jgi:hypothetical protein
MTVTKAFLVIIGSALRFGAAGALLGLLLGVESPGFFRSVYEGGHRPDFCPAQVGLGLGLSQGLVCGLVMGAVVVLAVAGRRPRKRRSPAPEDDWPWSPRDR